MKTSPKRADGGVCRLIVAVLLATTLLMPSQALSHALTTHLNTIARSDNIVYGITASSEAGTPRSLAQPDSAQGSIKSYAEVSTKDAKETEPLKGKDAEPSKGDDSMATKSMAISFSLTMTFIVFGAGLLAAAKIGEDVFFNKDVTLNLVFAAIGVLSPGLVTTIWMVVLVVCGYAIKKSKYDGHAGETGMELKGKSDSGDEDTDSDGEGKGKKFESFSSDDADDDNLGNGPKQGDCDAHNENKWNESKMRLQRSAGKGGDTPAVDYYSKTGHGKQVEYEVHNKPTSSVDRK
eukprot:GHVS01035616.1.p1 GENE.GHVS01035616.1~~GHVS01035616.1.p1  ORF type:complete len:292 (-),score=41.02 GHVS01035616.1:199-1074(-)